MENKHCYNQIYRDFVKQSQQNVINEVRESQEMGKPLSGKSTMET